MKKNWPGNKWWVGKVGTSFIKSFWKYFIAGKNYIALNALIIPNNRNCNYCTTEEKGIGQGRDVGAQNNKWI